MLSGNTAGEGATSSPLRASPLCILIHVAFHFRIFAFSLHLLVLVDFTVGGISPSFCASLIHSLWSRPQPNFHFYPQIGSLQMTFHSSAHIKSHFCPRLISYFNHRRLSISQKLQDMPFLLLSLSLSIALGLSHPSSGPCQRTRVKDVSSGANESYSKAIVRQSRNHMQGLSYISTKPLS